MAIDEALLRLPENRVLLWCASGQSPAPDRFAALLGEVVDWQALVARLQKHRLLLLFAHHLAGHEALLPPDVSLDIEEKCEQMLHQNLFLLAELQEVNAALTQQNIPVLSFKGPSVALGVYKSLSLRNFVDLDLLVSPRKRPSAIACLKRCGFREIVPPLGRFVRRQKLRYGCEMSLVSPDGLSNLDLHWRVAPAFESFPLEFEELWRRRVPVPSLPDVFTLGREDLIIALSFHGFKHGWKELEWVGCLLALLLDGRDEPLDWQKIETVMASPHCGRIVKVALRLTLDLAQTGALMRGEHSISMVLGEVVPVSVRRSIEADASVNGLATRLWKTILQPAGEAGAPALVWVQELVLGVRGRQSFPARVRFAFGFACSSLLSLERSRTLLSVLTPFMRLFPALVETT